MGYNVMVKALSESRCGSYLGSGERSEIWKSEARGTGALGDRARTDAAVGLERIGCCFPLPRRSRQLIGIAPRQTKGQASATTVLKQHNSPVGEQRQGHKENKHGKEKRSLSLGCHVDGWRGNLYKSSHLVIHLSYQSVSTATSYLPIIT